MSWDVPDVEIVDEFDFEAGRCTQTDPGRGLEMQRLREIDELLQEYLEGPC